MSVKTYREMNEKIKDILRMGDSPECLYAAQRIEELEHQNELIEKQMQYAFGRLCMIGDIIEKGRTEIPK